MRRLNLIKTAFLALTLVCLALSSTLLAQDAKPAGKTVELGMMGRETATDGYFGNRWARFLSS
jgi:hypothetical protein